MSQEAALRGYLLEEVLAKLLKSSGYELLTRPDQDPEALSLKSNGLVVHGRGASHQADALGDLAVPIPFSLPVRLFLEAKFRGTPTGLGDVRNALGVVNDVNERHNSAAAQDSPFPFRRYHYRYSLFSTSGFTRDAERYALAHQISLIDLKGPAFASLRDSIGASAASLLKLHEDRSNGPLPVGQIRHAARRALGTVEEDDDAEVGAAYASLTNAPGLPERDLRRITAYLDRQISDCGLVLGFLRAPFLLALQPDDVEVFEAWLDHAPSEVGIDIRFRRESPADDAWVVIPHHAPDGARLRFGVPERLLEWLVNGPQTPFEQAVDLKRDFFSSVVVFNRNRRGVELRLQRRRERWMTGEQSYHDLRRELSVVGLPEAPHRTQPHNLRPQAPSWNLEAAQELLRRLTDAKRSAQVQALSQAALTGYITRDEILALPDFPQNNSTLRNFLRPVNRITRDLERTGLLTAGVEPPLTRVSTDSSYEMPHELAAIIRQQTRGI